MNAYQIERFFASKLKEKEKYFLSLLFYFCKKNILKLSFLFCFVRTRNTRGPLPSLFLLLTSTPNDNQNNPPSASLGLLLFLCADVFIPETRRVIGWFCSASGSGGWDVAKTQGDASRSGPELLSLARPSGKRREGALVFTCSRRIVLGVFP